MSMSAADTTTRKGTDDAAVLGAAAVDEADEGHVALQRQCSDASESHLSESGESDGENGVCCVSCWYLHDPYSCDVLPRKIFPCAPAPRSLAPQRMPAACATQGRRRPLRHRNAIFRLAGAESAVAPSARAEEVKKPRSMCCYFKQKGFCKMGKRCWHGHSGDVDTPCHYGAGCTAGHASLVRGDMGDATGVDSTYVPDSHGLVPSVAGV